MGKAKRERRDTTVKWAAVAVTLAPIKAKIRDGLPLTVEEQRAWNAALAAPSKARKAVAAQAATAKTPTAKPAPTTVRAADKIKAAKRRGKAAAKRAIMRTEYDPYSGASKRRSKTSRTKQGPAGGVRSVVNGGAPGLGKRH
jgi:hypothetical protein